MHSTMKSVAFLLPSWIALSALPAADLPPPPRLSNQRTHTMPVDVSRPSPVVTARLYVSTDSGTTWTVAQELAPATGETPRFSFTAPSDGLYSFVSQTIHQDGYREPEPRSGTIPHLTFQIDTTAPAIGRFSARTEALEGSNISVRLAWTVSDAIPADQPAIIEISADAGATFAPLLRGSAQGDLLANIPAPTAGQRLAVRLRAEDRAGNQTTSAVVALDPAPVDPQALAAALAALPTLAPASPPMAPAPPIVRPELVAPNQSIPPAIVAEPEIEVLEPTHAGGLDQEYRRAQTGAPATRPAWQKDRQALVEVSTPEEPLRPTTPALPEGIPPVGNLTPLQAQLLLVQAREAGLAGDDATALTYFRRLRGSPVASQARLDEVRLLRLRNRSGEGLALIDGLSADQLDDPLRVEHGRLLIAAGRAREALGPLTAVRQGAAETDEALFVIAQALAADGKADQAKKVYAALAKGTGLWAQAAQQQLAGR